MEPYRNPSASRPPAEDSIDGAERIRDFLARHGGAGRPRRDEILAAGSRGWSEVYAADGYTLRCDWSRTGDREEMAFVERPPQPD